MVFMRKKQKNMMLNLSQTIRFLSLALLALVLGSCISTKPTFPNPKVTSSNCVVAHRGAWKMNNLPQNSVAALKQAIYLKCAGSEFDVRMTADDSLVINHDPKYNELEIEKSTYQDLVKTKLPNGEVLPTLREYLIAGMVMNTHTMLVCEIKPSEISKQRGLTVATKVVNLVNELNARDYLIYISFDFAILKKIHNWDPKAATQYLEGDKSPDQLKADGISGTDFHYSVYEEHPDWIDLARKNNISLNVWTVNDTVLIDKFLIDRFDFITTNEPELVLKQIKTAGGFR